VKPSYAISFGYCFADSFDKSNKQYKRDGNQMSPKIAIEGVDCLVWQCLASVMIPGFVIHQIVKYSGLTINAISMLHKIKMIKMYGPTAIGLMSIPLIIHPIDHFVDKLMDNTYRQVFKSK